MPTANGYGSHRPVLNDANALALLMSF
jgi:hypothetical protein